MALITKQYLFETVSMLLGGGNPSAGKKYEEDTIKSYIQLAVNAKLKSEYFSITLPSDETIPDGLVLACYDNIPVKTYKGVLSRAKLPAMPVSLRRNMGIFFVGPARDNSGGSATEQDNSYLIIEAIVGGEIKIQGTSEPVTGIEVDSSLISSNAFAGKVLRVFRGSLITPSFDPGNGSTFTTKPTLSTNLQFDTPLNDGEFLRIEGFIPIIPAIPSFTLIESIVDLNIVITGAPTTVTGIAENSTSITSPAFINKTLEITRGSIILKSFDPGDGSLYFLKNLSGDTIVLNSGLDSGEYLRIETK